MSRSAKRHQSARSNKPVKRDRRKKGKHGKGRRKAQKRQALVLRRHDWILLGTLMAVTLAVFANTFGHDFVNWDDDYNLLKNDNLRNFDLNNIKGIFTEPIIGNYNPLPIFMFAIEKAIFGLDPVVYHVNNVILHLICTAFAFLILRIMGLNSLAAFMGALIFGVHPMRVESVAWITERKDVLFGAFYMAAIYQYIRWVKLEKSGYLILSLILAVFALLAKIQAVSLPLSFIAVDVYFKRAWTRKAILDKVPFFGLSLLFGLLGIYFLNQYGSLNSGVLYGLGERLVIGAYTYCLYIAKFVYPFEMSPLYPYPNHFSWYMYASFAVIAGIIALLIWSYLRGRRAFVFGILFYTFNVMFVLQIVGAGQGYLADRFTYIPYFGLIFIVAYALDKMLAGTWKYRNYAAGLIGCYIAFLGVLAVFQNQVWKNSDTLWTHVLTKYDMTPLPYRNRANYYRDQGEIKKALEDYSVSLRLKKDPEVFNSRARLYFGQKRFQEAIADYDQAIKMRPNNSEFWINRGASYASLGDYNTAVENMNEGLRLDPGNYNGYKNRSLVLQALRRIDDAHRDILRYNTLNPYDADMWYESGRIYRYKGNNQKAIGEFNRAIRLNPDKGIFYLERSKAFLAQGNKEKARADLAAAKARGATVPPETEAQYK